MKAHLVEMEKMCYDEIVGRRVLPAVASRLCYRRREECAMTAYEIIMERILSRNILSVKKLDTFPFL